MSDTLKYWYRFYRAQQLATYAKQNVYHKGVDLKIYTGSGAFQGYHAIAAYKSAQRIIYRSKQEIK